MKIKFIITSAILFLSLSAFAQRIAYVDSEFILSNIPEYVTAQKQLDELAAEWQTEVDKQFAEIEEMYQEYQEDQASMSAEMRRRREDMIVSKEREVKEYQRLKFGFEGDLFKERNRLIGPVQNRVTKAIEIIAERQDLDMILDKGSETFLFVNLRIDKSKDVLAQLGITTNNNN